MSTPSLTLTQYLLTLLAAHPEQEALARIMNDLALIGKQISTKTNKAGLVDVLGGTDSRNIHGEHVQKLDVFANELCKSIFKRNPHIAAMASEEEEMVVNMEEGPSVGEYIIAFDPLDGSSNIDVNVSIGTIFSVHKKREDVSSSDERQFFQKGSAQVLAGYILYGSSTVLIFSFGNGVHECTLDHELGEWYVSNEQIQIPKQCTYYSVNETYTPITSAKDRAFLQYVKEEKKCDARHIGSLVADVHRNLIKGGVHMSFGRDKEGAGMYKAKLRLNYELKPLAFVLKNAGGSATNGYEDILDILPSQLHERQPVVMGNSDMVAYYNTLSV
ncbi:MAG: fructose-bisphosphatase [Candidatus Andersenbacteria bacterium RIFCSPLOWO2_12_FULL_45_8]|nr:MAG: fructose-bisphosphatase [Candidatus Magasanikbacteria bacterium RIFCSPLOWO2_02_FULL_47_16]OGH79809.1 MAG: fructose-bisphosphatase [Candidatus Magasanikbacteria bacterium RIFCSPHIGHO2_02_FULL_48_18]OGY39749.1 MAG: fructose-bisphosphatase [Candidatus Andersenbacteria bacterium RIFCSPLOWO2_12_FULL_45_8]